MLVEQIYLIVNTMTKEILGETELVTEDLSKIVTIGEEILSTTSIDNYVHSLVNHIGRVVFVDRPYYGSAPSVLMDAWEFGSILEKIRMDIPDAEENESWNLRDGQSYDPNIFYQPKISAKFFNSKVAFEIPISLTDKQVRESFSNLTQLNALFSMIYNTIDRSMTLKTDALIMRTINNMSAQTLLNAYPSANYSSKSGVRAVNLLYLYNQENGTTLTASAAMRDPAFLRFAAFKMSVYKSYLSRPSRLFNVGGTDKFTSENFLHFVVLSDFAKSTDVFLQSDVFHNELTAIEGYEEVPYWQGSGLNFNFSSLSSIDVLTEGGTGTVNVKASGILGVMFDRDALGVSNLHRYVTTHYNAKAEFTNNWYKGDGGYYNDLNENFVLFFVA